MILTSSVDCSVRMWKTDGTHVGIFGQNDSWDIEFPSTFSPIPNDVRQDHILDRKNLSKEIVTNNEILSKSETSENDVKSKSLQKSESILRFPTEAWTENTEADLSKKVYGYASHNKNAIPSRAESQNRVRVLQARVVNKWKAFTQINKQRHLWEVDQEILRFQHSCQHFSYSYPRAAITSNKPKVKINDVKPEAVYKELARHTKYELEEFNLPEKPIFSKDISRFLNAPTTSTSPSFLQNRKKWDGH
ncbi:hypothetical protein HMI56_006500 [Coelomomyces lativittatus]|nr:hypothetical protein HMI56_006500 [Coelomomyces lativittatus]